MSLFTCAFGIIIACVSYFIYQRYFHIYTSIIVNSDKRYDYIIGAGTAGCVLAARLSEDSKTRVLVVEAGNQMSYFTKIPLTPTVAQLGPYDWSVRATPQKYSSFGLYNQTPIIPRGKGFGGSGQINFMMHGVGLPEDYERWHELGFKGWRFDNLKPYFMRAFGTTSAEFDSEMCLDHDDCDDYKAPFKLKLIDLRNELMNAFREASSALNEGNVIFKRPTWSVAGGERVSTWNSYLKPALNRKNLHVLPKTVAVSIRFEGNRAVSVYILKNGRELNNIFVSKEVILCAGTIKTPQILALSGIGSKKLLQKLKVKIVAENEEVGRNFHDHMNMPVYVSIQKPLSVTLAKIFSFSTLWDYIWKNEGLLSFPPVAGIEYIGRSSALMLFAMGSSNERLMREISNYKPQVFRKIFHYHQSSSKEGFIFLATCAQPRSRGTVTLRDINISTPPLVDPNYLHDPRDVECIVKAMKRAVELVKSKPFRDIGARIHWPRPERCQSLWNGSKTIQEETVQKYNNNNYIGMQYKRKKADKTIRESEIDDIVTVDYLECIVREGAVTGHHAGGTCAGGKVVDDELSVKSVSGVRIMDASVLPAPVSLYPNSVLIAMAERAADLIKKADRLKNKII